jgi:hypothetical protein
MRCWKNFADYSMDKEQSETSFLHVSNCICLTVPQNHIYMYGTIDYSTRTVGLRQKIVFSIKTALFNRPCSHRWIISTLQILLWISQCAYAVIGWTMNGILL